MKKAMLFVAIMMVLGCLSCEDCSEVHKKEAEACEEKAEEAIEAIEAIEEKIYGLVVVSITAKGMEFLVESMELDQKRSEGQELSPEEEKKMMRSMHKSVLLAEIVAEMIGCDCLNGEVSEECQGLSLLEGLISEEELPSAEELIP